MAGSTIGALNVRISADNRGFKDVIKDTKKDLGKTRKALNDNAEDLLKWSTAGVAAAGAIGAAIFQATTQNVKELRNLAQAANTVTAEFQRGAFAANTVGIAQEKYGDILKDVTDRVGDFVTTGGGPMLDFFEQVAPKIGITAEAFRGLSGQDALGLFVQSLEKANLSQEEMTFYMEAIASDSTRLLPLLQNNAEAFNELAKQAESLGVGLSEIEYTQIEEASKALDAVGASTEALIQEVVAELAPIVTAIAKSFTDAGEGAGDFGNEVQAVGDVVVNSIGFAMDAVEGVSRTFEVLGRTVALTVLGIEEGMLMVADAIVNKPVEAVNELIDALNTLPWHNIDPVELSGFGETIKQELDVVKAAIGEGVDDIANILNEPMPSEALKEGIAVAKEEAKQLAAQSAEAKKIRDEQVKAEQEERNKKAAQEKIGGELDKLREQYKSEEQLLAEKLASEKDLLDVALAAEVLSKQEHGELLKQIEAEQADALLQQKLEKAAEESAALLEAAQARDAEADEIEEARYQAELDKLAERRASEDISQQEYDALKAARAEEHEKNISDIKKKAEDAQLKGQLSFLQTGEKLLAQGGKKTEKITKGVALAQAIIKGKTAAVSAFEAGMAVGGPLAPVTAALYAASSIAQTASMISSIKSSGKSAPRPSSSVPRVASGSVGGATGDSGEPQVARRIDINLGGEGFFSSAQVRQLIEQINEETDNGVQLNAVVSQ